MLSFLFVDSKKKALFNKYEQIKKSNPAEALKLLDNYIENNPGDKAVMGERGRLRTKIEGMGSSEILHQSNRCVASNFQ